MEPRAVDSIFTKEKKNDILEDNNNKHTMAAVPRLF